VDGGQQQRLVSLALRQMRQLDHQLKPSYVQTLFKGRQLHLAKAELDNIGTR
jgi:hypothetical protein